MSTTFQRTGGPAAFIEGYITCALWSSIDEQADGNGGPPMDENYSADDLAEKTRAEIWEECSDFVIANFEALADWDASQAGHDFWLTRNGHGAGFWDRGMSTGDALSEAARLAGSRDLYAGDDGKLYQS